MGWKFLSLYICVAIYRIVELTSVDICMRVLRFLKLNSILKLISARALVNVINGWKVCDVVEMLWRVKLGIDLCINCFAVIGISVFVCKGAIISSGVMLIVTWSIFSVYM